MRKLLSCLKIDIKAWFKGMKEVCDKLELTDLSVHYENMLLEL